MELGYRREAGFVEFGVDAGGFRGDAGETAICFGGATDREVGAEVDWVSVDDETRGETSEWV